MEEKVKWVYSAKIHGGVKANGSLMAASAEEAKKLIKQFGFHDWKLTDPNGVIVEETSEEKQPPPPPPPVPAPSMPQPLVPRLVPPSMQQPNMAPPPAPRGREVRRQQSIHCGPQKEIVASLKEDMNKPNAKVMHVVMHPDAHGVMWFAYVIEFDQEEIK
jgi:hypothetical protein